MPGQLLPLRLLGNSVSSTTFSTMKRFQSSPSGVSSVFSRMFPFRMKYPNFSRTLQVPNDRKFSTGSFRGRNGGGRINAVARRSLDDRGESKVGSFGAKKSLIEEEDGLSDWISELKTDSLRVGLASESDGDDGNGRGGFGSDRGRGRGGGRGRGRGGRDSAPWGERGGRDSGPSFRSERGGRDSTFRSERGGRDSAFRNERGGRDAAPSFRNERGGRDSSTPSFRNERGGRNGYPQSSRRGRDSGSSNFDTRRNTSGGEFLNSSSKRPFLSESEDEEELSPRRGGAVMRGERDSGSRSKGPFLSESEDEEELSPRRGGAVRRDGRDSESSYAQGRGGGVLQKGRRQSRFNSSSEDEGEEDPISSFGDLLSEDDCDNDTDTDTDIDDDLNGATTLGRSDKDDNAQPTTKGSSGTDSYLSDKRFDQCSVSPLSLKGIKDAGYERMTVVQEATLPVILRGKDVLAKAKTGTGKTVAFLLPAIEAIVKSAPVDRDQKRPPVFVLVICPTRELANQAAAEANTLLKYHPSIGVQVVIGGVRLALEQKRLQANPCQILVATPGRLKDHIENTAGFATRLNGVKVLVLDEADHLLDMGFRKDIEKIIAAVPKQRQTLLFSATVPEEVRQICHVALKRDHEFINTVVEGSEETHSQVRQMHLVAPLDKHFPLLYVLLKEHISEDVEYKVLVFCTTAMVTRLVASLLSELNLNVREIHSRKPQSYRTRVSDEFRKSKGLILVTSDVSARGVDYPDVTLVIQVGLPADREQYIHRLGRTGRKGKEGKGILMLAPWEEFFLSSIKDLPITKASSVPSVDPDTKKKVERALTNVEMKNKEAAYQAWLGFYNSNKTVGRDKCRLVELANEFSRTMGLDNPPAIPKLILGKMGLRNVPGLRTK